MDEQTHRRKSAAWYAGISALVLLPCYWQPRIQAGDLASHIYNSWLARLAESGHLDGLVVVRQTTNVLFDLILKVLFELLGPEAAQRIAVSLAVLVFFWGAWAFICTTSRRRPSHLLPCLGMLAYGWVFHMGLFNYYLSLGMCFWALALVWRPTAARVAWAVPLVAVAYAAHALPVVWTVSLLSYAWVAQGMAPRRRIWLLAVYMLAILGVRMALTARFVTHWSIQQMVSVSGADQVWVFGGKYFAVLAGLLLVWGALFLQVLHRRGTLRTVLGVPFQTAVLGAAGVLVLPGTVLLPGFNHTLTYIAERMSLGVAVCVCATLAASRPRRFERGVTALVALAFFAFLYVDERALNRFEDRMQGVVAQLPAGGRVVSAIADPGSRIAALAHVLDRACLGRCFSFGNYEASTAQFRLRATRPNPWVIHRYADAWAIQSGTWTPLEAHLPLFEVTADARGNLALKPARAGVRCRATSVRVVSCRS
jgi:hypothetical protein